MRSVINVSVGLHAKINLTSLGSELSGPYEIASNHLKILHSTLEEICAVLDYIPASRNIAALNAVVNECNRFLVAIDRALEYQDRQPLANNATDVKFTTRIQLITKKLLDTYRLVILPADISTCQATVNKHRRCAMDSSILSDTSCELDGSALTTSRMESSGSAQGGVMVPSHASTHSSERPVSKAADGGQQNNVQMGRPTGPSPVVSDSWKAPFALADPMSSVRPPQDMSNVTILGPALPCSAWRGKLAADAGLILGHRDRFLLDLGGR